MIEHGHGHGHVHNTYDFKQARERAMCEFLDGVKSKFWEKDGGRESGCLSVCEKAKKILHGK